MKSSPPYLASTVRLVNAEPTRTPTTLNTPVMRIAPAARYRTVIASASVGDAPVRTRQKYSAQVIEIAPSEAARIIANCPHPKTNAVARPHPSRRKT